MASRKTMTPHMTHQIRLSAETYIPLALVDAAGALVEDIGETCVGFFPDFWANGDGLEVSFKRVRKLG